MSVVLAPIESTPYIGGTATGVIYVDATGLQKTDGPTWDAVDTLASPGLYITASSASSGYSAAMFCERNKTYGFFVDTNGTIKLNNHTDTRKRWGLSVQGVFHCGSHGYLGFGNGNVLGSIDIAARRSAAGVLTWTRGSDSLGCEIQCGILAATAPTASEVPVVIELASAQSANAFEINSNGGTAGDVFKVDSAGDITASGGQSSAASDGTGKLTTTKSEEVHTLAAAATSDTTTISIPSGARLLGVSMNVNTAITGCTTWDAAFVTGSTTTIKTGNALTLDTKVDVMLPDEITSGVAEIRFTAQGGGASFTAGAIEVVVYYETLTSLANA